MLPKYFHPILEKWEMTWQPSGGFFIPFPIWFYSPWWLEKSLRQKITSNNSDIYSKSKQSFSASSSCDLNSKWRLTMLFLKWVVTFNSKVLTQAQWSSEMDLLRISKKSETFFSLQAKVLEVCTTPGWWMIVNDAPLCMCCWGLLRKFPWHFWVLIDLY